MRREAAEARAEALADMLEMRPLLERRTEGFSQGERMKTALARALVHDPANIVLDEPTNGLDVLATRALRDSLRWLRTPEGGSKCILFSTHIMQEVERLCDSVVVVARGRTVASGTIHELLAQTGQIDFEEAFVRLAFGPADGLLAPRDGPRGDAYFASACPPTALTGPNVRAILIVLRKELVDALRDRRTLMTVLLSSVLLGPLVLVAVSSLVASLEVTAERREVYLSQPAMRRRSSTTSSARPTA
jgi:ABC-type sugar transport system ATPase subunit